MKTYHWLCLILLGYFVIGTAYILLNPLWESPDEIHHYPMVQYLQTNNLSLPSQEPGTVGLWQQEGNQPPLYYFIGAILTAPIDTSNINEVMRVNPHADIGIIRPDGNLNRLLHNADSESFPGGGAVLATYLLRFFSLILGAGTVYITYRTALLIFPDSPEIAIFATGINAFIPMFVYISASVNNDNLSSLLANLLVLILMSLLVKQKPPTIQSYAVIGLVTGLGLLSKLNIGLLIPVVTLVLLIISIRHRDWKILLIGGIVSGGLTILIAGWWYWRNIQLFGDPTGLERFLDIVGRRAEPATLAQLWIERESFFLTFWGLFGSITVPMPQLLYLAFNWIGGLALLSGFLVFAKKVQSVSGKRFATALPILWIFTVLIAIMRWSSITPASQGRLIYGAISSISIVLACGIIYWLPRNIRPVITAIVLSLMTIITTSQPFMTIAPVYATTPDAKICENDCPPSDTIYSGSDGQITLYETFLIRDLWRTGDYIEFVADFAITKEFTSDWSIFIHVISPEDIIIAQRDVYPGGGLLATSDLESGYSWENQIAVYIPETTYAPMTVDVRLGWYSHLTGERMTLPDDTDTVSIGTVEIIPSEFSINFGNQIELIDYNISALTSEPGDSIELTLHWRRLQAIENDYVVFANVIDSQSLRKYADSNAMPVEWTRPTSTWQGDEIIVDTHRLTISGEAINGVYQIELGLYLQDDGFSRLPVIGTYDNFIYLTPFRIESE